MPVIPTYTSSQNIDTGARTMPRLVNPTAPLDQAVEGFGATLEAAGLRLLEQEKQVERFNTAQEFERFQLGLANKEQEHRNTMEPGAIGYHDKFMTGVYEPASKEFLAKVPDRLKPEYEQRVQTAQVAWSERVARIEHGARQSYFKDGLQHAAGASAASAGVTPDNWQNEISELNKRIQDTPLLPLEKALLSRNYSSMVMEAAIAGKIGQARATDDPAERDRLLGEARTIAAGGNGKPPGTPEGLVEEGNVDTANRPVVKTEDGRIATVRSITIGTDQGFTLIPTVSPDGKLLSTKEAVAEFRANGQHLGVFKTREQADSYGRALSQSQGLRYGLLDPDARKSLMARTETSILKVQADTRADKSRELAEVRSLKQDAVASVMSSGEDLPKTLIDYNRVLRAEGKPAADEWMRDIETARRTHALLGDLDRLTPEEIDARVAATRPTPGQRHFVDDEKIHVYAQKRAAAVLALRQSDPAQSVDDMPDVRAARDALDPDIPATRAALVKARFDAQAAVGIPETNRAPLTKAEAALLLGPLGAASPAEAPKVLKEIALKVKSTYGDYADEVFRFAVAQKVRDGETKDTAAAMIVKLGLGQPITPVDAKKVDTVAEVQAQSRWWVPAAPRLAAPRLGDNVDASGSLAPTGAAMPAVDRTPTQDPKDPDRPFIWKLPPRGETWKRDTLDLIEQPNVAAVRAKYEETYGVGSATRAEFLVSKLGMKAFQRKAQ